MRAKPRVRQTALAVVCLAVSGCGLSGIGGDLTDAAAGGTPDALDVTAQDVAPDSGSKDVFADVGCTTDGACDDGDLCTADKCVTGQGCTHTVVPCDDGDGCTTDTCHFASGCAHLPIDATSCSDGNTCTVDACDLAGGCTHTAVSGTKCDDGDACTSQDACSNGVCGGDSDRWLLTSAMAGGGDHWVGIAPRKDGTRLLVGWRRGAPLLNNHRMIQQRVTVGGKLLGTPQLAEAPDGLVIDQVVSHGADALVHGHVENGLVRRPWYGILDENDALSASGFYAPPNDELDGGLARAAFGKSVTGPDGQTSTRWYAVVDLASPTGTWRHGFFTFDATHAPVSHGFGNGNESCGALAIGDGVMVGTCDTGASPDYFRATFAQSGKITSFARQAPPLPTALAGVAAILRSDGRAWLIGVPPSNANVLSIEIDTTATAIGYKPVGLGAGAQVMGGFPQTGGIWLVGNLGSSAAAWHLDDDGSLVATRTFGTGTVLGGATDAQGLWLAGSSENIDLAESATSAVGLAARADVWGYATCAASGGCATAGTCADTNSCTTDWCDAGACITVPRTTCDDGDPCTAFDSCVLGACAAGSVIACDDSNPCTLDACGTNGCFHTPIGEDTVCDDGNPCTLLTMCVAGDCLVGKIATPGVDCGKNSICIADGRCIQPWAANVVTGGDHSCAVAPDGRIACWGENATHQLGVPGLTTSWMPIAVPGSGAWAPSKVVLGAGDGFNVAWIDTWKSVKVWGKSDLMQADVALNGSPFTTTPVTAASGLAAFSAISLGSNHGCALETTGKVKCWGASPYGQVVGVTALGSAATEVADLGEVTSVAVGGSTSCVTRKGAPPLCWGEMAGAWHDTNGNSPPSIVPVDIAGLGDASALAIGKHHGCGIVAGKAYCWGANDVGQLATGTAGSPAFGPPKFITNASAVAAGDDFACLLDLNGYVVCWGEGTAGQLGDGLNASRASPLTVPGLDHVVQLSAHGKHVCVRRDDGAVFCWGTGGIPDMAASASPVPVFDSLP